MVNGTITLNFKIEKGEPIPDTYYFSARINLTSESKNLLHEKLGGTVQFDNLDNYLDLNSENFYIYYNKYSEHNGRSELYVKGDNGRYLASNLPLNHNGFSIELSSDGTSIVDYGFYPLAVMYNPNYYNKAEEKVFDDSGELSPIASSMLGKFLSNTNGLATQDVFLKIQEEVAEREVKLAREKRQVEEELYRKNEELKELMEKGDITLFKVVKGNDLGNGRSVVVLQFDEEEDNKVILDPSKYYIAEYKHHPESEGSEYLYCASSGYDMLLSYEDLFFVLNRSSYPDLDSGFYSTFDFDSYASNLSTKNQYFSDNQLSEELSNSLERNDHWAGQSDTEFTIDNEQIDEEVMVENEIKSRKRRAAEEDDEGEKVSNSVNTHTKYENETLEPQEELFSNKKDLQEEVIITSAINSMQNDKKEDFSPHPLKVKTGDPFEMGKYNVELQVTYDDVKNFYDTVRNKYHVSKEYNYEQVMVLYNEIVTPAHSHNYEPFTLDKAYIVDGHLFIQDKDFGTLGDFNEMFYKNDELL
ncbi:hypothetical protein [Candidatus Wolbachia massiliensis]|uniref:Ankyrin repeat domain protein n=1 Tax=Candidatus Wolbachia massiliensis TaxID=1845000 RepID=A0A7L7YM11_9RICK|nr:hypothetical protein [Candidatus Wolbachia massiliensis]QOD38254.1 hypothetical protein ID128_05770 [Candidatus Wolbachia massiliensis]